MSFVNNPDEGRLVYDTREIEVHKRLFPQSAQDKWSVFIQILSSCYHQRFQNQEVIMLTSGLMWTQIIMIICKLGGFIQAY